MGEPTSAEALLSTFRVNFQPPTQHQVKCQGYSQGHCGQAIPHLLYMYSQPICIGKGEELNMAGHLQETKRHICQMALIIKKGWGT